MMFRLLILFVMLYVADFACFDALGEDSFSNDLKEMGSDDSFRIEDQEEAGRYTRLEPTSVELLKFTMDLHHRELELWLRAIERYKDESTELGRILDHWRKMLSEHPYPIRIDFLERLKPGDEVFYFEYEASLDDARYRDRGILVLRNNKVVYRDPFRGRTVRPSGVEIDDGLLPSRVQVDEL